MEFNETQPGEPAPPLMAELAESRPPVEPKPPTPPKPRWRLGDALLGLALLIALRVGAQWLPSLKDVEPQWLVFGLALVLPQLFLVAWPALIMLLRGIKVERTRLSPLRLATEAGLSLSVAAAMYVVVCAGALAVKQFVPDFAPTPPEFTAGFFDGAWYRLALLVFFASLVAPICEETFFRGFLYDALRSRMPLVLAIVLQGAAFGAVHTFSLSHSIIVSGVGVVLALVYQFRKTIVAPMIVHGVFNSVQMLLMVFVKVMLANSPTIGVGLEKQDEGLRVETVVAGSAAEKAGIQVGDIITACNGNPVHEVFELKLQLTAQQLQGTADIQLVRDGEELTVEVDLLPKSGAPPPDP